MPEIEPSRKRFRPYPFLSTAELQAAKLRRRLRLLSILAIVILAAGAYAYFYYRSFFEQTTDATVGTRSTELTAKVNGKVAKVLVKPTQAVKAGEPILQFDDKALQATLEDRQQALAASDERLAGGKAALARLQSKLAQGDAAARAKFEESQKWLTRQAAKNQELRNEAAHARAQLTQATVRAPGDGYIARIMVGPGDAVTPEQPVVEVVGLGMPWVVANFKEPQLARLHAGQRAKIDVQGIDKTFVGSLEALPANPVPKGPRAPLEKFFEAFAKKSPLVPVRITFDPKSIAGDMSRLVNGTKTWVRVYIK